jgi:hypothetical protein
VVFDWFRKKEKQSSNPSGQRRVADLSRDELVRQALVNPVSGLPNGRAYFEDTGNQAIPGYPFKRTSEMTDGELRTALLTDHTTGLPNKRAFDESPDLGVIGWSYIDDHYKWLRSKFGYEAFERTILAQAKALRDEGITPYRLRDTGGDLLCRFDSEPNARRLLDAVTERLKKAIVEVQAPHGTPLRFTGIEHVYGIGGDMRQAEVAVSDAKKLARAKRGDTPESPWLMWLKELDPKAGIPDGSVLRVLLPKQPT